MLRRGLALAAALLIVAAGGCQHTLKKDGSYSEFRDHAQRLDLELHRLHVDIKEIFFGLENDDHFAPWKIYD